MLHHEFDSTRIVQGWFYPAKKEIILQFPDGVMWWYRNCTKRTWEALVDAPSAGQFLANVLDSHRNGPV